MTGREYIEFIRLYALGLEVYEYKNSG